MLLQRQSREDSQVDEEHDALAQQPTAPPGLRAAASNMCYIIFTSGSMGRPKGAVLQHDGAVNFMHFIHRCANRLRLLVNTCQPAGQIRWRGMSHHPVLAR